MPNINYPTGAVTKRPVVQTEVQVPTTSDYEDLGLPFYYYFSSSLSFLLIAIGVIVLFAEILIPVGLFVFFKNRKQYICPQCKRRFNKNKNELKICPHCKCKLLTKEEYYDFS